MSQIAASSTEQARGIEHIGTAITKIETVTQNNAANAQETADAAAAMSVEMQTTRTHLDELVAVVGLRGSGASGQQPSPVAGSTRKRAPAPRFA